ncbi:hypothetical protein HPP92_021347 [Vanilla planifolia]|uniref:Uncharacterized protein n=1 Tax=Vanilla planifolia TaxID=51239 RepID=A0A835UHG9_VANPL|nr:hypothetical protein HPP92_021347 [Vanilla planifolia]
MAGGNFLGRIIGYVVNELVVEGLANNPSFQRFAVRTSKTLQDLSTKAEQTKQELTEQIREASKTFDRSVEIVQRKEIRKAYGHIRFTLEDA